MSLVEVQGLTKTYAVSGTGAFGRGGGRVFRAVDDVSFAIDRGEVLGLNASRQVTRHEQGSRWR